MNLILLEETDFVAADKVVLAGRRAQHIRKVHRASVGDRLLIGRIDGRLGHGQIEALTVERVELRVPVLDVDPPKPASVALALALPRPHSLQKVLQYATAMGVKRFYIFHSARVEKSYWSSSGLSADALRRNLILGLEQAVDTVMPTITFHRRFRPFVEDELGTLRGAGELVVAHPASIPSEQLANDSGLPGKATDKLLVVGPEGGLVPFELQSFATAGARHLSLGSRILRVETAVVAMLTRLGCTE